MTSSPGSDGAEVDAGLSGDSSAGSTTDAAAGHWVGTWTGAPQLTETANLPPVPLSNAVLRQVVHATLGGSRIRVKFSNEFGDGPVTIDAVHVAVCKDKPLDSTIDTTTDTPLTFSGMAGTTIAQGMAVWSDPVDFTLGALSNLSVTTAFGAVPTNVTGHPGSRTTSYEVAGSTDITEPSMTSAMTTQHWYILDGVDVMGDAASKGLVILGDSLADGRGSDTDGNDRWPDDLSAKMQANLATADIGVMNQGIGGNAVTTGGLGPTATQRFMRDVLGQSAVKYVVVFEGVNDLGAGVVPADITAAYATFIMQAHAQNLLAYGTTITPFGGNTGSGGYYTAGNEANRQTVNAYIRSGVFDAVIDFDATISDGGTPPKIPAQYDSGDGLHLNPAGYQVLAGSIDLTLFTR